MKITAVAPGKKGSIDDKIKSLNFKAEDDGDLIFLRDLFRVILSARDELRQFLASSEERQ